MECNFEQVLYKKERREASLYDFPDGPGVKNSPANAGDTCSIPNLGSFHMPQINEAHVSQLLSPVLYSH